MTNTLKGKVAIITGSARNIGKAIAHALSNHGASVVIHGQRDQAAAESVRQEIVDKGGNAIVHLADLADEHACQGLVDATVSELGRVDILVCNAAIRRQKPFLETSFAEWREVLAVDLDSVFLMTRAAAPHIIAAGGGSMVCIGGSPSHTGTRSRSHVCAAKMGVVGLARVLANELGEHGINVNVVAPGHVDTTRGESAGKPSAVTRERPIARKARPEEIAAMVCHLCLPASRYVTGQVIHVNGGMLFAGA
ncbi:MAG: SDR family oxidoreductase [Acidiferrobacterales bacterium]|nr:SDR family oxidoreductase [Acidiferrobacterales bacterium]